MGRCTVRLGSRFAGGVHPMPPPPPNDQQADKVFRAWLDWVNRNGIVDLAAMCAASRSKQVAFQRQKVASGKSTWGNGSCFAVVEVLRHRNGRWEVVQKPGWSQYEFAPEGKVHAERSAISQAYSEIGGNIEAVTRIYVELAPCTRRAINQHDTCDTWLATIAPNATVMYSHDYSNTGIAEWKKLNEAMAKEPEIYQFITTFANAGNARLSHDGSYVSWQGDDTRAKYHETARILMGLLENQMNIVVPLAAAARVDN